MQIHKQTQQRICQETFIEQVRSYATLASTNDEGLRLAREAENEAFPLLVHTAEQTKGRGTKGRQWWSEEGALTISIVTREQPVASAVSSTLPLQVGLGIGRGLQAILAECGHGVDRPVADGSTAVELKWPNDVLIGGKKACGILVESIQSPAPIQVIGIGLNVNQAGQIGPSDVANRSTSLRAQTGMQFEPEMVLIRLLHGVGEALAKYRHNPEALIDDWRHFDRMIDQPVVFDGPERRLNGICRGIDAQGGILIEIDGELRPCYSGSIRLA